VGAPTGATAAAGPTEAVGLGRVGVATGRQQRLGTGHFHTAVTRCYACRWQYLDPHVGVVWGGHEGESEMVRLRRMGSS